MISYVIYYNSQINEFLLAIKSLNLCSLFPNLFCITLLNIKKLYFTKSPSLRGTLGCVPGLQMALSNLFCAKLRIKAA